jgi:flagellar export protein FliJ
MKKFQFNLEKLLSYKGQILDSEMMTLAVLNNQLHSAEKKLAALREDQIKCKTEFEKKMLTQTTPADCQLFNNYADYLKGQIKLGEKEIEVITKQIDQQIEIIKKIKLETKSLDTIKTSRLDEYIKKDIKTSELQIDEFVATAKIMKKAL